jgi:hypothetical protein
MGAMTIYFTKGIKVNHLKKVTGRYYRFALMLKLVLFELFIVSIQQMPMLQLVLMSVCQFTVLIIIFRAFFIERIYSHKFFGFMDLMTELTIMLYLAIGLLVTIKGSENLDPDTFLNMQLYEIYLILVTAGLSVIQVVYNGILSVYKLI